MSGADPLDRVIGVSMQGPEEEDDLVAGLVGDAQDDVELETAAREVRDHTAALAKEAAASAGAAAKLAKIAASGAWKVLSIFSGPAGAVTTATKATTSMTPVPGIVDMGVRQVKRVSGPTLYRRADPLARMQRRGAAETLRRRGNELIGISHRAEHQPRDLHPSFSRILDELTPDEARILRFLAVAGPQPVIDVRTKTLFQVGSELLVEGIGMVTEMAGCRYQDRDLHYFANLNRLGLLYYSKEPVDDYRRYALIEVQPRALHAVGKAKKAITLYHSIALTAFGKQFVRTCIDTAGYRAGGWDQNERGDKIIGKGPPARRPGKATH